jgi:hypothetical protein
MEYFLNTWTMCWLNKRCCVQIFSSLDYWELDYNAKGIQANTCEPWAHTWITTLKRGSLWLIPNAKPETMHGILNAHNRWFILCYHVWGPAWIEIHWNSIWSRVQSHKASHYTWGSVTTPHDFGGVSEWPLDTFFWTLTISRWRLLAHVWSGPKLVKLAKPITWGPKSAIASPQTYIQVEFGPGEIIASYILHTPAFGTYLLGGYLPCKKDYKVMVFYMLKAWKYYMWWYLHVNMFH